MPMAPTPCNDGKVCGGLSKWIEASISPETLAVHGGTQPDPVTGAILTPLYLSTTFVQPSVENYLASGYSYSRQDNPTTRALEHRITALEEGADAVVVSSGMAATVTVFSAFLKTGDHCILTQCSYGGTNRCARVHFSKYDIEFSYVDMLDLNAIKNAIKPNTKMIFSETPTNPILQLADVKAISDLAKKHNDGQIIHVCDSTFATPFVTKPLTLGADIVIQSTTKYYDGHNVTFGGCVIVKNPEHYPIVSLQRNILGNMMAPNVAFFTLQATKTLHLRVARQSESAMKVAEFLESHPKVLSVTYPGLKSYPQRELALRQHLNNQHGGMLCFEVEGGSASGRQLMNAIKRPWSLCENLGACESIITCPAVFTHANMLEEDRKKVGITDGLVRVSVGLEDSNDLIVALKEALDAL